MLSLLCPPLVSYLRCSRAHNAAACLTVTDSFVIVVHPQVMAKLVSHDGCKHLDADPSKLHRSNTEGSQHRTYTDKVNVYFCAEETLLPFCLCVIRILRPTGPDFQPVHGICLAVRALRETHIGHYPTTSTSQSSCNINTKTRTLHTSPILLKCANFSTSVTGPKKPDFWDCELSDTSSLVH